MPAQKSSQRRLGRGLSSLISPSNPPAEGSPQAAGPSSTAHPAQALSAITPQSTDETTRETGRSLMLAIAQIKPNPHQPRRAMDEFRLKELADSIASSGVIQPIIVRQTPNGYELIAGERRLRAAKLAGMESIPAIVRAVDSDTQAQMALVENIQRQDLNPIERALGYQSLMRQLGLSQMELAARVGEDRSNISHHIALLNLPQQVQDWLAAGKLSMGHAKLLATVESPEEVARLAAMAVAEGLTVRNLERILAQGPSRRKPMPNTKTPYIQDLEKQLSSQIGLRVQVQRRPQGRGKLVIHYSSLDEFDELMDKLHVTMPQE